MSVPRPVQQTLNARAVDAHQDLKDTWEAFNASIQDGEREMAMCRLRMHKAACYCLLAVFEEYEAVLEEHTP